MLRNEAQTRFNLIYPAFISQYGYARVDIRIEETPPPVGIVYAKGESIAAAYDLKAVNPNRVSQENTRKPQRLLDHIAEKVREAAALLRLRGLRLGDPATSH